MSKGISHKQQLQQQEEEREQQGQPWTQQPAAVTDRTPRAAAEEQEELDRCTRTVFFACVPPCVAAEGIEELFNSCGTVRHVNLFKPWATAKTSKVRSYTTAAVHCLSSVIVSCCSILGAVHVSKLGCP
jgi:hypothetical protein